MYSFFRGDAREKFASRLDLVPGQSRFEKLLRYNQFVSDFNGTVPRDYTFDRKLKDKNFVNLPGENVDEQRNCFENALDVYLAAKVLCPESKPRLVNLNEGKRGVHATVMLFHEGKVYQVDPNYNIASPIVVTPKNVVGAKRKLPIKSISEIQDKDLEKRIESLRRGDIRLFLTGGQCVERNYDAFRPYSIFMKVDGSELISEIRFIDFSLSGNTAFRRIADMGRGTWRGEYLVYRYDDWAELKGEQVITSSQTVKIGEKACFDRHSTLADLRKGKVLDFLVKFGKYHSLMYVMANGAKKDIKEKFFFKRDSFAKFLEIASKADLNGGTIKYAKSISDYFLDRYLEQLFYCPYAALPRKDREKMKKGEESKVTWEMLRKAEKLKGKGIGNIFGNLMTDLALNENERLRNYFMSVFEMMKTA